MPTFENRLQEIIQLPRDEDAPHMTEELIALEGLLSLMVDIQVRHRSKKEIKDANISKSYNLKYSPHLRGSIGRL